MTTLQIINEQTPVTGTVRVSAAVRSITPAAVAHLPERLDGAEWQLLVHPEAMSKRHLLRTEEERSLLNTLKVQSWSADLLARIESGRWKVAGAPVETEMMLFYTAESLCGGVMGACSLSASGLGLLPTNKVSVSVPIFQMQAPLLVSTLENAATGATTDIPLQENLAFFANTHPAAWVYYLACYKLLANNKLPADYVQSGTGFYDSAIWKALYSYQRDGVESMLEMLDRFDGCILADSVGLGKTYEALAVIHYYTLLNKKVLVLCPKRLHENWGRYLINSVHNPFAEQGFRFDLFHHTDLGRSGFSNSVRLESIQWGNYDLVVIDESHNFRNRSTQADKRGSRYQFLMQSVKQAGIKTKFLLLSATPVNNKAADLRNQLLLISGDKDDFLAGEGIESIRNTTRRAQSAFTNWTQLSKEERSTEALLDSLSVDYFQLLNLVTIGRSRAHIKQWYPHDANEIRLFPEQLPVRNEYARVVHGRVLPAEEINEQLSRLSMALYRPLEYLFPEQVAHYDALYDQQLGGNVSFRQRDREQSLSGLMLMNLLKRMESSVSAFGLTVDKQLQNYRQLLDRLAEFDRSAGRNDSIPDMQADDDEEETCEELDDLVGGSIRVNLRDIDRERWCADLRADVETLCRVKELCGTTGPQQDAKLGLLRSLIREKLAKPLNTVGGKPNRKIIIFTAFADTARYLYEALAPELLAEHGLHTALITGARRDTNVPGLAKNQEDILSAFAPLSTRGFDPASTGGLHPDILIATDCISEGQNLQDCDYLINYDIHWNPVRIIQRFGRIDRIGSPNKVIQLVNIWPMPDLDAYINLESRVRGKMEFLKISSTEAEFRNKQLEQLRSGKADIDTLDGHSAITDLSMHRFRTDQQNFRKKHRKLIEELPPYFTATLDVTNTDIPAGAFFLLCLHGTPGESIARQYPFLPHFLLHVAEDGTVTHDYSKVKPCLELLRRVAAEHEEVDPAADAQYRRQTKGAREMKLYTRLLQQAVLSVTGQEEEGRAASIFSEGGTTIGKGTVARGVDDFEVLAMLTLTRRRER